MIGAVYFNFCSRLQDKNVHKQPCKNNLKAKQLCSEIFMIALKQKSTGM